MATLITVLVLNSSGTMLRGFASFFFWILIAMVESVYLSVRVQRAADGKVSVQRTDSIPGGAPAEPSG